MLCEVAETKTKQKRNVQKKAKNENMISFKATDGDVIDVEAEFALKHVGLAWTLMSDATPSAVGSADEVIELKSPACDGEAVRFVIELEKQPENVARTLVVNELRLRRSQPLSDSNHLAYRALATADFMDCPLAMDAISCFLAEEMDQCATFSEMQTRLGFGIKKTGSPQTQDQTP